jgi:CRP-like cAMP-binding protein
MVEVPPELCRIAERALRAKPSERYQSVDELHDAIEGFLSGGGWFATRRYEAGQVLIREGDPGAEAFIISSGTCEVFKTTSRGEELIRSMGPGDAFGELSVLTSLPRSATVVAKTEVVVRVVTPQTLERELGRNPVLAGFMSAVARRFMDLEARLAASEEED